MMILLPLLTERNLSSHMPTSSSLGIQDLLEWKNLYQMEPNFFISVANQNHIYFAIKRPQFSFQLYLFPF